MTGSRLTPLAMLERLVAFDTVSHKSNLPLIDFVADYLRGWSIESIRIPDASGTKAALFATIGPRNAGGVVLSGHTDVVPVEGQNWSSDPFSLRVDNGNAYGRGAVDMKGFCALALALVPEFLEADLARPIHLFLSYDEEINCMGVLGGIARFGQDLPQPIAVIVGEPTDLKVADAHKSILSMTTTVHGREAHSSRPAQGASAIDAAVKLAGELMRMAEDYAALGDASGRFDPPCSTIHIGRIEGGTARNIVANRCSLLWEVRGLPDLDAEALLARFKAFGEQEVLPAMRVSAPEARIETVFDNMVPGLMPRSGSYAETLALRLAGQNSTVTVPYGTEAGHFQAADVPTVVCGPGSIRRAHQADEYITLDELEAGAGFLRRLAQELRQI